MDGPKRKVLQRLLNHWDDVKAAFEGMSMAVAVRPDDGWRVFRVTDETNEDPMTFEILPVVLNIPERASHRSNDLFVVVGGVIQFRRSDCLSELPLLTYSFKTRVAYFRVKRGSAEHIYGAHYDFAPNQLGHPVFHSQMCDLVGMWTHVEEQYEFAGITPENRIRGILGTVRVPSAQMDVFSFLLQLFADHLLSFQSGTQEKARFNDLLNKNSFLRGAGAQAPHLTTSSALSCFRASHWYPEIL